MRHRARKILIADDSRGFLGLMTSLLQKMGFSVVQAGSGAEALRILKGGTVPDLLILDVYMPEMDGFQTLEALKELPGTGELPVVMLSVDTNDATISKCRKLGCDDYLGKPVDIDSLHDVLQKMLFSVYGRTRKHVRAEIDAYVKVVCDGGESVLKATTISEGGIYLLREEPFPVGTELTMLMDIGEGRELELGGVVIYIHSFSGSISEIPPGMAVEFRGISPEDSYALAEHIKSLLMD